MSLILCDCGRWFRKYGHIVGGSPDASHICLIRCPFCGHEFTETPATRQLTSILNGDDDSSAWDFD